MGRTIAFTVAVKRLAPRDHRIDLSEQVMDNIRIDVFVDCDAGRRVRDIDNHPAALYVARLESLVYEIGNTNHLGLLSGSDLGALHAGEHTG